MPRAVRGRHSLYVEDVAKAHRDAAHLFHAIRKEMKAPHEKGDLALSKFFRHADDLLDAGVRAADEHDVARRGVEDE